MHHDIKLLTEIYSQNILNEDPDFFEKDNVKMAWNAPNAIADPYPFMRINNVFLIGKVRSTHTDLFVKNFVNAIFNQSLGEDFVDGIEPRFYTNKNSLKEFLNTISTDSKHQQYIENLINSNKLKDAIAYDFTPSEYYSILQGKIKSWGAINYTYMRTHFSPAGRVWFVMPNQPAYISTWTELSEVEQKSLESFLNSYARKNSMSFNGRFEYEEFDEEEIDPSKAHIETDPFKRKRALLAKGVKPGSSKEAEMAQKAGYKIPASWNAARIVGDSKLT